MRDETGAGCRVRPASGDSQYREPPEVKGIGQCCHVFGPTCQGAAGKEIRKARTGPVGGNDPDSSLKRCPVGQSGFKPRGREAMKIKKGEAPRVPVIGITQATPVSQFYLFTRFGIFPTVFYSGVLSSGIDFMNLSTWLRMDKASS
jgi:hypothetical protein